MAPESFAPGPQRPARRAPGRPAAAGALDELARILAAERERLLRGDWAALAALGARKEACMAALSALGPEAWREAGAAAAGIGRQVGRNQAILAAAIEGLRDAGHRRAMLRSARSGFQSYDSRGARVAAAPAPPRVERKA